jgi:hypothetical protein
MDIRRSSWNVVSATASVAWCQFDESISAVLYESNLKLAKYKLIIFTAFYVVFLMIG